MKWNKNIQNYSTVELKKCRVGVKFHGNAGLLCLGGCVSFLQTLAYLPCKSGSGILDTDNIKSI